jgi:transcriptional regulator of heat shock response
METPANKRKKAVLRAVVREHLRTAEPVGSESICQKYDLDCSSATVRNDLAALVEEGLLVQPHTSAGRVPTAEGYRTYVEEFVREAALAERQRRAIMAAMSQFEAQRDRAGKAFARMIAEMTGETVVIRTSPDEAMFSGLTNLASKPEARYGQLVVECSRALDQIEETMDEVRRRIDQDVSVLIGADNPFGDDLGGVFTRLTLPGFGETTIAVVGPKRMDYEANISLLRFLRETGEEEE